MNELISKLRQLNIKLSVVDGKLKINAPKGVVTKEIIQSIKVHKNQLLDMLNQQKGKEDFYKIPKAEEKTHYELSLAQNRLYFIHLLDPQSTSYNMPQYYKILGELEVPALEEAFRKIIDRHESFRTCFEIVDDRPVQKILPAAFFELEEYDGQLEDVEKITATFIRPFDLSKGQLIRVGVVKLQA